jgi:hypothetical protein
MAAGQMVSKKSLDMDWANLLRPDLPLAEPSAEVPRDSAVRANRAVGVTPSAKIAGEGLRDYVNLIARTCFMSADMTAQLLVHSEA